MIDSPCADESFVWRQCLKEDNYSPDRNFKKCEAKRSAFYSCLAEWRTTEGVKAAEVQRDENFVPECQGYAAKLHGCMKLRRFVIDECAVEMDDLKKCTAEHDPAVRQALGLHRDVSGKSWWKRVLGR
jgi:hypothetical protein